MGRLSAQNQMYIGIGLIVVLALLAVFLLIVPVFQEASTLSAQIAGERGNLSAAEALLARRQSAKAQAASNEVELMRIANQLPDSPQLPAVIIEIQDVANAAGLSLESISPQDMVEPPSEGGAGTAAYMRVPITLQLRGDWPDYIDFLHRVARLDRGVRITSVTLTGVPGTEATATEAAVDDYVDGNIEIEVYVMAAAVTDRNPGASASDVTTATAPGQ